MQFQKDSQTPKDVALQEAVSEHAQKQAEQAGGTPEKQQTLADEIKDDAHELCEKLADNDSDEVTPEQAWLYSVFSTNTLSL